MKACCRHGRRKAAAVELQRLCWTRYGSRRGLYKGMYDDLKNLDREYFRRLTEEGLVPMTTHVPK